MSGIDALRQRIHASETLLAELTDQLSTERSVLAALKATLRDLESDGLAPEPPAPAANQGRLLDSRPSYRPGSLIARCLHAMRTLNRPMTAPEVRRALAGIDVAFDYSDHQVGSALSRLGIDRYVERCGVSEKFYVWELLP